MNKVSVERIENDKFQNVLSTVNVVEEVVDTLLGITSFPDDKEGNRNAEIHFFDLVRETYPNELEENIEVAIEDGVFDKDQYHVFLIHS